MELHLEIAGATLIVHFLYHITCTLIVLSLLQKLNFVVFLWQVNVFFVCSIT